MSFNWMDQSYNPEESYSRQLDRRVALDEHPYGYEKGDMAAGHVNRHDSQSTINDKYVDKPEMSQKLPWDYKREANTPHVPRSPREEGSFPDLESKIKYKMKNG